MTDALQDSDGRQGGEDTVGGGQADTGTQAPNPQPAEQQAPVEQSSDWRDAIGDEKLRSFAKGYNSVEDVLAHALSSRQKLGRALVVPGEGASDEELSAFRAQMGVPEAAGGYRYRAPDGLPDTVAGAITEADLAADFEAAFEAGLSQRQVEAMMDHRIARLVEADAAHADRLGKARENSDSELRRKWGEDYKANRTLATRAAREFGGDGFVDYLAKTEAGGVQLANDPRIMEFMASAGRRMMEANLRVQPGSAGAQGLEQRRVDLTREIHDARAAGDNELAKRLDQERSELTRELHGAGDIVGINDRGV